MNKMNNISNSSTALPMHICTLPILCDHGRFSAIVKRTQSDHSDCRHWMEGVSMMKPGSGSFFLNIYPVRK